MATPNSLAALKEVVFDYLQLSFPGVQRHALLNNSTPVDASPVWDRSFLTAANNARKAAETAHDWQACECALEGTIPLTGVGLSWDEMVDEEGVTQSLKSITAFGVVAEDDLSVTPVSVMSLAKWNKLQYDMDRRQSNYCHGSVPATIVHHGRKFYSKPTGDLDIDVRLSGYKWLQNYEATAACRQVEVTGDATSNQDGGEQSPNGIYKESLTEVDGFTVWTADGIWPVASTGHTFAFHYNLAAGRWFFQGYFDGEKTHRWHGAVGTQATPAEVESWTNGLGTTNLPVVTAIEDGLRDVDFNTVSDYFLLRGFDYMQWATICEMNHLVARFVPRQEGALNPPDKLRDLALQRLIVEDSFAVESGDHHDIRDD